LKLASSLFMGARTYISPYPHSTPDNKQYVDFNAFDLVAGAFCSEILSLNMWLFDARLPYCSRAFSCSEEGFQFSSFNISAALGPIFGSPS
jgi:hypothetical protein